MGQLIHWLVDLPFGGLAVAVFVSMLAASLAGYGIRWLESGVGR